MIGGSVSSSFSAGPYEFDNIDVNINGRIHCTYYYHGNCSVQCPSGNLMEIIESMVYKFVRMLPNIVDVFYDTIDFFGDVIAVDDNIKSFPIYFVLSGNRFSLYRIDPKNIANIFLVSTYNNIDDAIDYLYGIDRRLVENYYEHCEGYVNGQLISNGNNVYFSRSHDDQDINGDCNYDIVEVMHGDITGDMHGNIKGVMHGDVMGDMYGDINGVMHGDVMGDMYGDIKGVMHGDIMGDMYGNINEVMYGDIMGSFEGMIYGKMFGDVTE